jgi:hypothetical protein
MILTLLERYKEALPDLEIAKKPYGKDPHMGPDLFKRLEKVYRKLGLNSDADAAHQRAEELSKKATSGKPGQGPAGPINPAEEKSPNADTAPKKP